MKLEPWRLHDLRRTAASGLARLGFPLHVIEAVLNHRCGQISGVAAVYNRHSYLPEKRKAIEPWSAHVLHLAGGAADNVVLLQRQRLRGQNKCITRAPDVISQS